MLTQATLPANTHERLSRSYTVHEETGCWLWSKTRTPTGYGRYRIAGHNHRAHRVAYTLYRGDIPSGMLVCHRCDTPLCINPDHLFVGTHADNMQDCIRKGRFAFSGDANRFGGARANFPTRRGERSPNALLNDETAREIFLSRERMAVLARRYGISETAIGHVRGRRSWTHVTADLHRKGGRYPHVGRSISFAGGLVTAGLTFAFLRPILRLTVLLAGT